MVEIKAGEKYVCANGDVVGPIEDNHRDDFPWRNPTNAHPLHRYINWSMDGKIATVDGCASNVDPEFAIVAKFSNSPIREITRKEIVPGVYGHLDISAETEGGVYVDIVKDKWPGCFFTPDELDAAASVLNQIAAVLRENGK